MAVLLLLVATVPHEHAVRGSVDVIEINYVVDCNGREVLRQLIFWNYDGQRYQVVAWRIPDCTVSPRWNEHRRRWVVNWWDAKSKCRREIEAVSRRQSVLGYDIEVRERSVLPEDQRQGLRKPNA